ncbi:MAG TPA: MBL fold metallo-hydrolase [Bacteroidia bacterium]|nr:MBL fold metallo-hydrolase [Bacteroidia bacterium]
MSLLKSLGKNPSGKRLERIKQSPNYKNNAFQNLSHTEQLSKDTSYAKIMKDNFSKSKHVEPKKVLPFVITDLHSIQAEEPTIVWFGHSSYLLKINGKTILVDPVFSGNASPFSFMIKAFKGADEYKAEHMPKIDLLLLTHDHYDHLDYKTLKQLRSKIKEIYCPLGVGSHLEYWGFEESRITELDWWETNSFANDIEITAAPARHYTGRTMVRSKMLWASYILKTKSHSIYLGGDSGYDTHFKKIGDQYGPFDIALLESGQYNTSWPNIHMMPEETVQASIDLKANVLFPIHWAKFALAMHDWDEPIKRVLKKAEELSVKVTTPMIGEPLMISKFHETKFWWEM